MAGTTYRFFGYLRTRYRGTETSKYLRTMNGVRFTLDRERPCIERKKYANVAARDTNNTLNNITCAAQIAINLKNTSTLSRTRAWKRASVMIHWRRPDPIIIRQCRLNEKTNLRHYYSRANIKLDRRFWTLLYDPNTTNTAFGTYLRAIWPFFFFLFLKNYFGILWYYSNICI